MVDFVNVDFVNVDFANVDFVNADFVNAILLAGFLVLLLKRKNEDHFTLISKTIHFTNSSSGIFFINFYL